MMLSDVARKTKALCDNDQSIQDALIQDWVDDCINQINQLVDANYPLCSGQSAGMSYVPAFDVRYHELLVLFCVQKYREADSDYTAAQHYITEVQAMQQLMQRDMAVPPSYKYGDGWLQLVAADTTGVFDISILPRSALYSVMRVFQNDNEITRFCKDNLQYVTNNYVDPQLIVDISQVTINVKDKITVQYEESDALQNPPYEWWGSSGW